jgi:hypothetical protein
MTVQPTELWRIITTSFICLLAFQLSVALEKLISDLRFGIFWQLLQFSLQINCSIIDACLHLHNYILEISEQDFMDSNDKEVFDEDCWQCFVIYPDIPEGVHGGDLGAHGAGGRPSRSEFNSASIRKTWRDLVWDGIFCQGLSCPRSHLYRDIDRLFERL